MVLDLSLPDASGYSLARNAEPARTAYSFPPVIVYTGRDLSATTSTAAHVFEVDHHQGREIAGAPPRRGDAVPASGGFGIAGRTAEDDPKARETAMPCSRGGAFSSSRTTSEMYYALTNILEPRGAIVEIARNGREAIDALERSASQPGRRSIWC